MASSLFQRHSGLSPIKVQRDLARDSRSKEGSSKRRFRVPGKGKCCYYEELVYKIKEVPLATVVMAAAAQREAYVVICGSK